MILENNKINIQLNFVGRTEMIREDGKFYLDQLLQSCDLVWAIDGYDKLEREEIDGYACDLFEDHNEEKTAKISKRTEYLVHKHLSRVQSHWGNRLVAFFVSKNLTVVLYYFRKEKPDFSNIIKNDWK